MLNDLLDKIEPRWRPALERLIEEGEADAEFLAYLETSPHGDSILDAALAVQSERIHALGDAIRTLAEPQSDLDRHDPFVAKTAAQLREVFEAVAAVGTRERMRIFDEAFRDIHPDDLEALAVALNGYRYSTRRRKTA
jgi:hypothetical protein